MNYHPTRVESEIEERIQEKKENLPMRLIERERKNVLEGKKKEEKK